ncbi:MAG TPA: TonB family protein [Thermoanaerobaculia bacterium]|nr:TonB family protein [Thermoanaerobaculia bacterium]
MFETVAPAKASPSSRNALYEALSFSLFVHLIAGGAALVSNLWQVTFPATSPTYTVAFVLAAPPPPPPPPPPPKPLEQKPETITTAMAKLPPNLFVAPTVIPDQIPIVRPEIATPVAFAVPNGVLGGVSDGLDYGVLGGIKGGEAGGKAGGTIGGVAVDDGRIHIERDKKLPMTPVSQVYPSYPEDARIRAWEDQLVVRYVIGKDGRVKEVTVVSAPERDIFVDVTVRAIRSWRFKPMIRDGERQEVVHELTVYDRLNQPAT